MITGVHAIINSTQVEEVRAFFRDVLKLPSVDAGRGWLIFALPPAEVAVHPAEGESTHELYLMCDDIEATVAELKGKGVQFAGEIGERPWGRLATIRLASGTDLGIYEPRHPTAIGMAP